MAARLLIAAGIALALADASIVTLALPPLQTNMFWHRRYNQDPGNAWLRKLVAEAFAKKPA